MNTNMSKPANHRSNVPLSYKLYLRVRRVLSQLLIVFLSEQGLKHSRYESHAQEKEPSRECTKSMPGTNLYENLHQVFDYCTKEIFVRKAQ